MLLNTCCGCVTLRKGTLVIGALSMISAIINAIMIGNQVSGIYDLEGSNTKIGATPIVILIRIVSVSVLIYTIVGAIVSALMITGVIKNISSYVFPWLALGFGSIIGGLCVCFATVIATAPILSSGFCFLILLILGSMTALQIYFWLVVYSHYKEAVAEKYGHQTRPNDGKVISPPPLNPYHNV